MLGKSGPQNNTENQWIQLHAWCWLSSAPHFKHFGSVAVVNVVASTLMALSEY